MKKILEVESKIAAVQALPQSSTKSHVDNSLASLEKLTRWTVEDESAGIQGFNLTLLTTHVFATNAVLSFYGLDSLKPKSWTEEKVYSPSRSMQSVLKADSARVDKPVMRADDRVASADLATTDPLGIKDNIYRLPFTISS